MFNANIKLFPAGVPSNQDLESKPVAHFSIKPKDKCVHQVLFLSLPKRFMNRTKYSGDWITEGESQTLQKLTDSKKTKIHFILGEKSIPKFFPPIIDSFTMETNNKDANEVSRVWFRKDKNDIYTKRDGITLEGNGLSGFKLMIVKQFFLDLSPEGWHSESSKNAGIDIFKSQVTSSKGFVFFITEGQDTAKEWVETGMDFMKFTLAVASQDLAFHTMNQALEDYKESITFHATMKEMLGLPKASRIQLMGRLGRSDYSFSSPRRELANIFI